MNQLCTEKITYTHFLRLSGLLVVFCGFLLFVGCASQHYVVENSKGYDATDKSTYQHKVRPDWTKKESFEDEKNQFYVIDKESIKSDADAINLAYIAVRNRIVQEIQVKVSSSFSERISELRQQVAVNATIENQNKIKELEVARATEETFLKSMSESSAAFSGLKPVEKYWEREERKTREKDKAEIYKCWIQYSIPKAEITAAREAVKKRESFEEQEKNLFEKLHIQAESSISTLSKLNFEYEELRESYKKEYSHLSEINANLQGLSHFKKKTLPPSDSELLQHYDTLLATVEKALKEYDVTDRQKQVYESRIRFLQREKEQIEQLSLTTNIQFASFQLDTNKKITDLYKKLELKEQEVTSLERERNLVQNVLADYTTQVKSDFAAFATNEKSITEKTAQTEETIRELERSILLKENEVKTLETQKNATEKALEKYTEQIKSDIASLVNSRSVNREPEQQGESLVTNLKKQIADKQSEIDALEKRLVNQAEQYTVLTQNTKPLETTRLGLVTEGEKRFYIVSPGDTLVKIASYDFTYGDYRKWRAIYDANVSHLPNPQNPELLHPGIKLLLPD